MNSAFHNSSDHWLELIELGDDARLKQELEQMHPADISRIIEHLPQELQLTIFNILDEDTSSEVLAELDEDIQASIIEQLSPSSSAKILYNLDSDDAADVLGTIEDEHADAILQEMNTLDREELTELLSYDEETAGGIMAKEAVHVSENLTVDQAIQHLRKVGQEIDDIYNVYLVNKEDKFVGTVSLRKMILASPDQPLKELMEENSISVNVNMDQEEVARMFRHYDLVSAAVVDGNGRLLGRITHDDIMDVFIEEAHEDIARLSGQGELDPGETSVLRNLRHRLPWLMLALLGEIGAASLISHFEPQIAHVTALAFFLPLIAALGGNAGIQTSTLVVRGLATGEIRGFRIFARIMRELSISLLTGFICGSTILAVAWYWQQDMDLAIVIGLALMMVMMLATIVGAMVPLVLSRIGLDPALATGPFITTTNDILGLLIYLGIASIFLFG